MALHELQKNFRSLKIYWFQRDTKEINIWKVGDRTQPFHIHRHERPVISPTDSIG